VTTIRKLLIANRGEIASRIMRTARSLDITTVAIFSEADASAPFVRDADEAVALAGNSAAETYLRGDLIIEAALRTGVDAIHPGYGFLSENAGFAAACGDAGLIFVGPPPAAIAAMGSKIAAKALMAAADVPVLPGITIEDGSPVPSDLPDRANSEVGYPVLVKAAFGGGGRGMRIVRDSSQLLDAVAAAGREAASAFGNGTVFLEHYLESPRHIEVQIFADSHGNAVHLFERECSIQRRYQKIIEEAPSAAVDDALRAQLGSAAVAVAKTIGYVGAGTVEFVMGADGRFFFLEVNTRLQVEHPVTELVTGLDLVRLQLLVAEGQPLPSDVLDARLCGHAIEARLYAEDVAAGFLPATGTVRRFRVPELPGIRVDSGVSDNCEVSVHYDPMLAKVIAHGPTRDDARRTLARALSEAQLHGVVTNRELLVAILREREFAAAQIDTGYLTRHDPAALVASIRHPDAAPVHALAVALADQTARRDTAPVLQTLPSGWRNVPNSHQWTELDHHGEVLRVTYRVTRDRVDAAVNDDPLQDVRLHEATPDWVDLAVAGIRHVVQVHRAGEVRYVDSALGHTTLRVIARFPEPGSTKAPGSLLAPMPGTVVRVAVALGATVTSGAPVIVLEAMKMEHTVPAPHDGTVEEVNVEVGQTVDVGMVLAMVKEVTVEVGQTADVGLVLAMVKEER
jgi:propionyl-CoA carboxylase alpha chain